LEGLVAAGEADAPLLERVDPLGHGVDGVERLDLGVGGEELREVGAELADPDAPQRERHISFLKVTAGGNATSGLVAAASAGEGRARARGGASDPNATRRARAAPRRRGPPCAGAGCDG